MTAQRHIARAVAWSLLRTWGGRLIGFFVYFQLARLLTPADIGLFAAGFALLVLMELLVDQGLLHAVVQRPQLSDGLLNAVFITNLLLALGLAGLLALAAPAIERWMQAPGLASVVVVSSAAVAFTALGLCQEALARRALDFQALALRTLASTSISGVVAVGMAWNGYGVWALVLQFVLASSINTLMLWVRPRWRPSWAFDVAGLGQLLRFGWHVLAARLVGYAGTRGLDLMVGVLLGPVALGLFSVGSKLQFICLQLLGTALVDVAYPAFSRLQGDAARLRSAHLSAVQSVSMVAMPLWALLFLCAPEAIEVAFGPRWAEAVPVLQAMALIGALQVLNQFDSAALNASGHPSRSFQLGLLRSLAALAAVGLARDQPLSVLCWAIAASQCAVMPAYLLALRHTVGTPLRAWLLALAPAWTSALLMGLVLDLLRTGWPALASSPAFLRLLVLGAAGLLSCGLFLMLFARPELRSLRRSLHGLRAAA